MFGKYTFTRLPLESASTTTDRKTDSHLGRKKKQLLCFNAALIAANFNPPIYEKEMKKKI